MNSIQALGRKLLGLKQQDPGKVLEPVEVGSYLRSLTPGSIPEIKRLWQLTDLAKGFDCLDTIRRGLETTTEGTDLREMVDLPDGSKLQVVADKHFSITLKVMMGKHTTHVLVFFLTPEKLVRR